MDVVILLGRLYLGAIWLLAGSGKLVERQRPLLHPRYQRGRPFAIMAGMVALAAGEVLLGVVFVLGIAGPWPALLSAGLFLTFGMLRASGRLHSSCGCFGALSANRTVSTFQVVTWASISVGLGLVDSASSRAAVSGSIAAAIGIALMVGAALMTKKEIALTGDGLHMHARPSE
ncbi:MAG: hypothetical protein HYX51_04275 [Chloroflexi bacterium]|nr:hypothetical protein [Chloroflexota bacterium]